jgi:hypothetical protein
MTLILPRYCAYLFADKWIRFYAPPRVSDAVWSLCRHSGDGHRFDRRFLDLSRVLLVRICPIGPNTTGDFALSWNS